MSQLTYDPLVAGSTKIHESWGLIFDGIATLAFAAAVHHLPKPAAITAA